eukprot:482650-Rhodomonas_salina.1
MKKRREGKGRRERGETQRGGAQERRRARLSKGREGRRGSACECEGNCIRIPNPPFPRATLPL